jgi:NADPH:quinone reductase
MSSDQVQEIRLKNYIGARAPSIDDFELVSVDDDRKDSECIEFEVLCVSVDPFQRCMLNGEPTGVHYIEPIQVGNVIKGGGIARVLSLSSSSSSLYKVGNKLACSFGVPWRTKFSLTSTEADAMNFQIVADASGVNSVPLDYALGTCGMPGLTSLSGLTRCVQLTRSDVVVVSGASGACGNVAAQYAKKVAKCALVVGIAGTDDKLAMLRDELGAIDEGVNYTRCGGNDNDNDVGAALDKVLGGRKISVYFDNVGGALSDAVMRRMADGGNVVLCGAISVYNDPSVPYPPPLANDIVELFEARGIVRHRHLVLNHSEHFASMLAELDALVAAKTLIVARTLLHGIDAAPAAFCSLFVRGSANMGKVVVQLRDY